jgi:crotonobetainyl-CoA:carnitine CoA-transferase CaiB-like acyl-CoA transferase
VAALLDGLRVLEVAGSSQAVAYCGLILARLGAAVVKLEPPVGDPARRQGPFPGGVPDTEVSAAFIYANRGKRSATLNLERPAAAHLLARLLPQTDVLLDDLPDRRRTALGLSRAALSEGTLVHVGFRPFGATGDWAELSGTALTVAHAGGESFINPSGLDQLDRPPLKLAGHTQEYDAGVAGAIAVLAALFEDAGGYRYLDLSEQDVVASMIRPEIVTAFVTGVQETRATRVHEFGGPMPCADGWVHVVIREAAQWDGLVKLMGEPEWAVDPQYRTREARFRDGFELTQKMGEWLLTQPRHELMRRAQAIGVPITAVELPEDVLASDQLAERDYFEPLEAGGRIYRAASPLPARLVPAPEAAARAPALGQHNAEVYTTLAGLSAEELHVAVQTGLI